MYPVWLVQSCGVSTHLNYIISLSPTRNDSLTSLHTALPARQVRSYLRSSRQAMMTLRGALASPRRWVRGLGAEHASFWAAPGVCPATGTLRSQFREYDRVLTLWAPTWAQSSPVKPSPGGEGLGEGDFPQFSPFPTFIVERRKGLPCQTSSRRHVLLTTLPIGSRSTAPGNSNRRPIFMGRCRQMKWRPLVDTRS